MAGDWIKMRVDLADDPAIIAIADALQVHETHVVGMLHKTWAWADRHAENGHVQSVTLSWLDRFIGVTGFAQAMIDAKWLECKDGLKFPHFDRHNGESAKKRATATERKRLERDRHKDVADMSQQKSDKSVTREEKRREDISNIFSEDFELFWQSWPKTHRKSAKGSCWKIWSKNKLDPIAKQIIQHVLVMKSTEGWKTGFDPAPAVYLNKASWEGAETPMQANQGARW